MTDVTFNLKDVVYRSGGPMDYVYFPRSGMLSTVVTMPDGATAEVGITGLEGMVGASTFLGADRSTEEVFCQIPVSACRRMAAHEFTTEVLKAGPLRDVVYKYLRGLLTASARQIACNCLHSVDERLARWLLLCHDRARSDEFLLTHEFLAMMLGVRRATVTTTAGSLQAAGIITYKHGKVTIRDRATLEEAACECYEVIRDALQLPGE